MKCGIVPVAATIVFTFAGLGSVTAQPQPGAQRIRVGVISVQDHAGRSLGYVALDRRMRDLVRAAGLEPVPLAFQPPADVDHAARQAGCGYILYTDVVDIRRRAGPELAAAFKGVGTAMSGKKQPKAKDIWLAEVEFRLFAIDQVPPVLSASTTGRNAKHSGAPKVQDPAAVAPTQTFSVSDPNLLTEATPVEETGRVRKHKSVAVASALEAEVKLVRDRIRQGTAVKD